MPIRTIHLCGCSVCQQDTSQQDTSQQDTPHPDKVWHQRLNLLVSRLDEQQRRWLVAHEAQRLGHGGDKLLSQVTGLDEKTIARGRRELQDELVACPTERVRHVGGGRPLAEKKTPR